MPRKTIAQLQKEARLAPKYILQCIASKTYITLEVSTVVRHMSSDIKKAEQYAVGYDSQEIKLNYWQAVTKRKLQIVLL